MLITPSMSYAGSLYRCIDKDGAANYAPKEMEGASCKLVAKTEPEKQLPRQSDKKKSGATAPHIVRMEHSTTYSYIDSNGIKNFSSRRPKGIANVVAIPLEYPIFDRPFSYSKPDEAKQKEIEDLNDAYVAYGRDDFATALRLYKPLATKGYAYPQLILGYMFEHGKGVLKDYQQALTWYRKAAEQGYSNAQYNLGAMYAEGQGVLQNYEKAHMWWNIAAVSLDRETGEKAKKSRDAVAGMMTPSQIEQAQKMAAKCLESKYKQCD